MIKSKEVTANYFGVDLHDFTVLVLCFVLVLWCRSLWHWLALRTRKLAYLLYCILAFVCV